MQSLWADSIEVPGFGNKEGVKLVTPESKTDAVERRRFVGA